MNRQNVLYEANLQTKAKKIQLAGLTLIIATIVAFFFLTFFVALPGKILVLLILALYLGVSLKELSGVSPSSKKVGRYQIYLDSIGLHVRSDEPAWGESFSVSVLNLHRFVRKNVSHGEDPNYEFFVEEKSGQRHQISPLLANADLNVMALFEIIASEFPSVKIVTE